MEYIKKINNTITNSPLLFKNNKVFLATKNGICEVNDDTNSIQLVSCIVDSFKILNDNTVLYQIENGKELFVNHKKFEGKYYLTRMLELESYILITGKENEKKVIFEIDKNFTNKKLLHLTYFPTKVKDDNKYLFNGISFLSLISFKDNMEFWHINLDSSIEGELINFQNLLIVPAKDQILRAFNINSGKKVWEVEDVYGFNLFLDKNTIYQLAGDSFKMIDASNGRVILSKNLEQENKKENIFFQVGNENVFDGKRIYFCSELSPKIGAFNIETTKVDWLYEFEKPQGLTKDYFLKRPQIHGEKLYVLDSNNTLHIFEHENE